VSLTASIAEGFQRGPGGVRIGLGQRQQSLGRTTFLSDFVTQDYGIGLGQHPEPGVTGQIKLTPRRACSSSDRDSYNAPRSARARHAPLLKSILTYHVAQGQSSPAKVDGAHATLQGANLTVTGQGNDIKVNDAGLVCGGVHTANATVYMIDTVLMPPGQ
jgi:hypothetical protein